MTQSHRQRYEGWRNDDGETVERFDKTVYRWVALKFDDVPNSVVKQRRE